MGTEPKLRLPVHDANEFASLVKKIHEEVHATLTKAQKEMKKTADQKRLPVPNYHIGQKVMLAT